MTGALTRPRRRRHLRDRWLVSYADMVTLLFACFATLYAAQAQIPVLSVAVEAPAGDDVLTQALGAALVRSGAGGTVELRSDLKGTVVSLPEAGAFPPGEAELSQGARRVIRELAFALAGEDTPIRVEGHTDDVPVRGGTYATNWDLSVARATAVVKFLISQGGIAPARLSATGFGEFQPRESNGTPEGRARNRRVDIVIPTPSARARSGEAR